MVSSDMVEDWCVEMETMNNESEPVDYEPLMSFSGQFVRAVGGGACAR